MALTSYSGLVTFCESLLNRADLSSLVPDFLVMAEAHFNRELRCPQMEASSTTTLVADQSSYALPDDFLAARAVYIDSSPDLLLVAMAPQNLRANYPFSTASTPGAYAISGQEIIIAPVPSSADTLTLDYFQKIPALTSTDDTNWLLDDHPDLYVWGVRYYAAEHISDEELAAKCLGNVTAIIDSITRSSNKGRAAAGPLAMRSTIWE